MTDVQTRRTTEIDVDLTDDGTLPIPEEYRRALGLVGRARVRVAIVGDELRVRPAEQATAQGKDWFERLYDDFAPARREALEKGYTEEEINAWIDEAVREVRAKRA